VLQGCDNSWEAGEPILQGRSCGRSGSFHPLRAPHASEVSCIKQEQLAQRLVQVCGYRGMRQTLACPSRGKLNAGDSQPPSGVTW